MILLFAMLSWFATRFRFKAALALAALYAFCVLAPYAAFAFAAADAVAHCLKQAHGPAHVHEHGGATKHVHADGTAHEHGTGGAAHDDADSTEKAVNGNCCGLFCLTALADAVPPALSVPALSIALEAAAAPGLASRSPDRINRPPIA
jgi:hypothetical protein